MGAVVNLGWFRRTLDPTLVETVSRLDAPPTPRRGPRIGRGESVIQVRGVLAERVVVSTELDPCMGLRALAAYSGLSVRNLRERLTDPVHPLPCYRPGGKIGVRRSEYDSWLAHYRQLGDPDLDCIVAEAVRDVRTASKPRGRAEPLDTSDVWLYRTSQEASMPDTDRVKVTLNLPVALCAGPSTSASTTMRICRTW